MTHVSDSTPRPSQTTMAAGMVMAGSALVVVTIGEQLTAINSLETRRAVTDFLATTPGTGLDVPQALTLLRTALMVVAGCATAAAVLGFHVLRRSRPARLGLTVLAVPLFLGGMATGGFLTALVAASSLMLWMNPSRAWLDRTPIPEPRVDRRQPQQPSSTGWPPPPPPPSSAPPASPPRTDAPPPPHAMPFGAPPPQGAPTLGPPPQALHRRPDAVVWACVLTWACSGLAVALLAASLTLLVADPSLVWGELERQNPDLVSESGLTRDELQRATYVTIGIAIGWAVLAMVLAVLAYRRRDGGRVGLVVCAGLAGVLCSLAAVGSVVMLVPAGVCLATVVLLRRPDVRAWYAARDVHP